MKPKRRLAFRSGLVLALLLIGVPVWIVGRAYRRERATHDLATALYKDDTRSALAALRAGADPNARRFEHDSPPTFGQSLRRFLQQLRGGKTVSEAEADHRPPMLALAAEKNNTAVVQALLKAGAVPDDQSRYAKDDEYDDEQTDATYGETALMWAAEHDNVAMAKALLDRGANPNFNAGYRCNVPLLETTEPDLMELLLAHGANLHIELKSSKCSGLTPLRHVIMSCLWGEGTSQKARAECYRCVDVLLAHGADIKENNGTHHGDVYSGYDITAIQWIAQHGEPADVRYLLAKGADSHLCNEDGWDALRYAIEDGMAGNMRVLLAHGVDPNKRDKDGSTPLLQAVEHGEDDPIRVLIAAGAKLNLRDKHGKTALRLAEEDDNGTVADILRAAGGRR